MNCKIMKDLNKYAFCRPFLYSEMYFAILENA